MIFTDEEFAGYVNRQYCGEAGRVMATVRRWIRRGDGAAVYENQELGNPEAGSCQIVSYGSAAAQLETADPPDRLPDIGASINWRYRLAGTYRGGESR